MKKRITIIGPIGDYGGRELETGFIAKTLSDEDHEVSVISTTFCTPKSQIFDFIEKSQLQVLDEIVLKKSILFRFLAQLSQKKDGDKNPLAFYASNKFSKQLGYKRVAINLLKSVKASSGLFSAIKSLNGENKSCSTFFGLISFPLITDLIGIRQE